MVEALIVLIVVGGFFGTVLGILNMRHREKMAAIEVERIKALAEADQRRALAPARSELANELLDAYEEAGRSLRPD